MDTKKIKEIIELFEESKVSSMELEIEELKIKLKKPCEEVKTVRTAEVVLPDKKVAEKTELKNVVKSPLVGTFYSASSPASAPFVTKGSRVNEGDVICIVEAMKVMNEIRSDKSGIVTEIFVQDGQMVQYDEPLLALGE